MTKDEVIAMAREAGMIGGTQLIADQTSLMDFARLVAARERDECAKVCDGKMHTFSKTFALPAEPEPGSVIDLQQKSYVTGAQVGSIACAAAIRARTAPWPEQEER